MSVGLSLLVFALAAPLRYRQLRRLRRLRATRART
jgi:hypothetical protein